MEGKAARRLGAGMEGKAASRLGASERAPRWEEAGRGVVRRHGLARE